MAAITVWRYTCGRVLRGWGPLLCVLLGSMVALLLPMVGVEDQCCATLTGIAQIRCQLWGGTQHPSTVLSTSLTVPFTALDILPQRSKPSKGTRLQHMHPIYISRSDIFSPQHNQNHLKIYLLNLFSVCQDIKMCNGILSR